jgi:hypothetical protein
MGVSSRVREQEEEKNNHPCENFKSDLMKSYEYGDDSSGTIGDGKFFD